MDLVPASFEVLYRYLKGNVTMARLSEGYILRLDCPAARIEQCWLTLNVFGARAEGCEARLNELREARLYPFCMACASNAGLAFIALRSSDDM